MGNTWQTPKPGEERSLACWFSQPNVRLRTWLDWRVGCAKTAMESGQEVCVRLGAYAGATLITDPTPKLPHPGLAVKGCLRSAMSRSEARFSSINVTLGRSKTQ